MIGAVDPHGALLVVYTERYKNTIRIISARKATKKDIYISKIANGDTMRIEKHTRDELEKLKDRSDIERLKNMTDEEIEEAARSDPDNPPLTDEQLKTFKRPSEESPCNASQTRLITVSSRAG